MKIVQLTTDDREPYGDYDTPQPYFGAAPEALLQGFARLPEMELHVVSCTRRPMRSPQKLADNIWFHSLVVPKLGWGRTLYSGCIRATRRALRAIQPDLVHGQGTERDCAIAATLSGFPNVITLHGIMQEQARLLRSRPGSFHWLAHRLENFALRRTAGVFCNSQYTERCVRGRARKLWRVANPIREAFFTTPPVKPVAPEPILLNIGFVCPRKRQNELLLAARELHEAGLKFQLQFLGAAPAGNEYGARFLELIGQNRAFATHLGFKPLPEIIRLLDAASALVHVPSEESFGLVVAEALARNLKLFGFQVGGVGDIAQGVTDAELFPDQDWVALKAALRRWIQSGTSSPVSGAKIMRERYHPEVIARRHLEIYREVLSTRS